jgi:rubrerythrin
VRGRRLSSPGLTPVAEIKPRLKSFEITRTSAKIFYPFFRGNYNPPKRVPRHNLQVPAGRIQKRRSLGYESLKSSRDECQTAPFPRSGRYVRLRREEACGLNFLSMRKSFKELDEREILALAISLGEEDERIYGEFSERIRDSSPATAHVIAALRDDESARRRRLLETYRQRFGDYIALLRRQDVKGFVDRKAIWLNRILNLSHVRSEIASMESETKRFYAAAAQKATTVSIRQLLDDLGQAASKHQHLAESLEKDQITSGKRKQEDEAQRRTFVLQVVQPGLAGLMDGSVSTLAPVFAAAFATRSSRDAFLVGMAASIGAGISMGFAEALSDDGALSGRGHPWLRGGVCGLMTMLGGLGHTLPYLIKDFYLATWVSIAVVAVELAVISWIRHHFMDTPLPSAIFQVVLGGVLVFIAGILIGSA